MSVVSDTATDTLLDYTVLTSPDPIQVSPEAGDPSKAALIVVVSNPQSDTVRVESITFQFDIGDPSDPDATYLTDVGTDIQTDAAPASQWQFPTSTDGTFRATPTGNNQILDQGLRFTIANIVVNGVVGTFDFTTAERAALGDGPAQSRSRTHKITKGPYAFSVGDFTADPANVPRGKAAILSWQGSENATYTMIWQDSPYEEDVTARRSWTTPPID